MVQRIVVAALAALLGGASLAGTSAAKPQETGSAERDIDELREAQRRLEELVRRQQQEIEELQRRLEGAAAPATEVALEKEIDEFLKEKQAIGWKDLSPSGSKLKFYGFLRLDAIYDDSRPNNSQTIGWILSEDENAPPGVGAGGKNRENFTMHPRLTRFGMDFDGPVVSALGDAKVDGKLEIDFYNNGLQGQSESRAAVRMRHAWARLGWGAFTLLAGQTNDVISPIFPIVNPDLVMWGAGNLGDRRPQVRPEYVVPLGGDGGKLLLTGMVGLTGADDNSDLDSPGTYGAGYRDGEASALPTLQARVGYRTPFYEKQNFEAGVWGDRAWEDPDQRIAGETHFDSYAYGFDFTVPVYEDLVYLKGEGWTGTNVDDVRGGIFQGINTVTGDTIDSRGGFVEAGFKPASFWTIAGGYSRDDPDNSDLNDGGRAANKIWYVGNRFKFDVIEFGFDYLYWTTEYVGFDDGTDNRIQAYMSYAF
jgi:hypothetical protein